MVSNFTDWVKHTPALVYGCITGLIPLEVLKIPTLNAVNLEKNNFGGKIHRNKLAYAASIEGEY